MAAILGAIAVTLVAGVCLVIGIVLCKIRDALVSAEEDG